MTVIMLAAGTSSRMGEHNKMLLPYKGVPMVAHCCLQALKYLETLKASDVNTNLIVATGYMRDQVEGALQPCVEYAQGKGINFTFAYNKDYEKGQYSSTVCAVSKVKEGEDFFINLSDMPFLGPENYSVLPPFLAGYDAVRPFAIDATTEDGEKKPGHPVLMGKELKKAILQNPDLGSVNRLLKNYKVHECLFEGDSWLFDVDNPQVYATLL
jgi:molybdenum cofactor cytidylyltransferase